MPNKSKAIPQFPSPLKYLFLTHIDIILKYFHQKLTIMLLLRLFHPPICSKMGYLFFNEIAHFGKSVNFVRTSPSVKSYYDLRSSGGGCLARNASVPTLY